MAQEATANEQKKFKVPRIPGDIMIYPMIVEPFAQHLLSAGL